MKPPIVLEIQCGRDIKYAIYQAIKLASDSDNFVTFNFNGQDLTVHAKSNFDDVYFDWENGLEAKRLEWEESEAGQQYEQNRLNRILDGQEKIDRLMKNASNVWGNKNYTAKLKWMIDFSNAHVSSVNFDHKKVVKILSRFHVSNYGVGKPVSFFNKKEELTKYVVGQFISMMTSHNCVHQMVEKFAQDALNK
jgi:hypothetical protein